MRQCTTPEQTVKLIELGFEKPRVFAWYVKAIRKEVVCNEYSIGELIGMLPPKATACGTLHIDAYSGINCWHVWYGDEASAVYEASAVELVDALYDMIIKLKEEGVI